MATGLQMRFKQSRPKALDREGAEAIAATALAFLAAEPARLGDFMKNSGMTPEALTAGLVAAEPGLLAAALDHIVCDESLLLVFASEVRRKPEEVLLAQHLLQAGPAAE